MLPAARNSNLICKGFLDSHKNPHHPHQGTETGTHYMLFSTPQARTRLFNTRARIALLIPSQRPSDLTETAGEDTSDSGYRGTAPLVRQERLRAEHSESLISPRQLRRAFPCLVWKLQSILRPPRRSRRCSLLPSAPPAPGAATEALGSAPGASPASAVRTALCLVTSPSSASLSRTTCRGKKSLGLQRLREIGIISRR